MTRDLHSVWLDACRATDSAAALADQYAPAVLGVVRDQPGLTTRALREAVEERLRDDDIAPQKASVAQAVKAAIEAGQLIDKGTGRNRKSWHPAPGTRSGHMAQEPAPGSAPPAERVQTCPERVPDVSPTCPRTGPSKRVRVPPPIGGDTLDTHTDEDPETPPEPVDPIQLLASALGATEAEGEDR